mgnify:CR=1 FL=1
MSLIFLFGVISIIIAHNCVTAAVLYPFGDTESVNLYEESRIGLCITGQIGRLELESKMEHIIKPLSKTGLVTVDVVLVLGNNSRSEYLHGVKDANQAVYTTELRIAEFLKPYTGHIRVVFLEQTADPVMNPKYRDNIGWMEAQNTPDRQKARTRSHIRQWINLRKCYSTFTDLEVENKAKYDAFIRTRDDGYFISNINPFPVIVSQSHDASQHIGKKQPDIIVGACDDWGGYNDKGAVVGRHAASAYFNGFLDAFYFHYDELFAHGGTIPLSNYTFGKLGKAKMELNPEQFTAAVLRYNKLNVITSSMQFPLIPTKVSKSTSFGKCFRIYRTEKRSMPCYCKEIPHLAQLISSGVC